MEQDFNANLRRLRKQKGMTQEQLADAVGVSAQAVSKWEQNGFPDTPLLPAIADSLGVSIDELFGRKQEDTTDIFNQILQYLLSFPEDERLKSVFDLCWAICEPFIGITRYEPLPDYHIRASESRHAEVLRKNGFLQAKADHTQQYFLLLPEPENGYDSFFPYQDRYVQLFEILAFPDVLRALYYLAENGGEKYHSSLYFTKHTLAHMLSIESAHAQEIIEKLLSVSLIEKASLNTGEKQEPIYTYIAGCNFVSFMTFAHTLLNRPKYYCYQSDCRGVPFFRNATYRNPSDSDKTGSD